MYGHYSIVQENNAETLFSGSLNECSLHVRTIMESNPGVTFVIMKVTPVSTHCKPGRFIPEPLADNVIIFPQRRELQH